MTGKIIRLSDLRQHSSHDQQPRWSRHDLAGRLIEVSGRGATASLTLVMVLVLEAQREGEPVAWIALEQSTFFPPDVADSGVDLDALVVVRVQHGKSAGRAADQLVRSGAFGLVILDLGEKAEISLPMQGRLVSLAQRHDAAIVCITEKTESTPSLGSMVSLRAEAMRVGLGGDRFRCKVKILKDKRRGPGWTHSEVVRGPAGLR